MTTRSACRVLVAIAATLLTDDARCDPPVEPKPVATVDGEPIVPKADLATPEQPKAISWLIGAVERRVLERFDEREGIVVTKEMAASFRERTRKTMAERETDQAKLEKQVDLFMAMFGCPQILNRQRARLLYERHGGPLGLSNFGFITPYQGRWAVLNEAKESGGLVFHDPAWEAAFWAAVDPEASANNRRDADTVLREPEQIEQFFKSLAQET